MKYVAVFFMSLLSCASAYSQTPDSKDAIKTAQKLLKKEGERILALEQQLEAERATLASLKQQYAQVKSEVAALWEKFDAEASMRAAELSMAKERIKILKAKVQEKEAKVRKAEAELCTSYASIDRHNIAVKELARAKLDLAEASAPTNPKLLLQAKTDRMLQQAKVKVEEQEGVVRELDEQRTNAQKTYLLALESLAQSEKLIASTPPSQKIEQLLAQISKRLEAIEKKEVKTTDLSGVMAELERLRMELATATARMGNGKDSSGEVAALRKDVQKLLSECVGLKVQGEKLADATALLLKAATLVQRMETVTPKQLQDLKKTLEALIRESRVTPAPQVEVRTEYIYYRLVCQPGRGWVYERFYPK